MKKTFIIFLLIIFSSSFSLAKDNEKITVEDIEKILERKTKINYRNRNLELKKANESWNVYFARIKETYLLKLKKKEYSKKRKKELDRLLKKPNKTELEIFKLERMQSSHYGRNNKLDIEIRRLTNKTPRFQIRGIARCMYNLGAWGGEDTDKKCNAKVIRSVVSYSEKSKKRRPGDIFYTLDAIKRFVDSDENNRNTELLNHYQALEIIDNKSYPLIACVSAGKSGSIQCLTYKKSIYKKIEKFKKDTSNEKVLGQKFIKFIKQARMVRRIEEKLGTDNYVLLGDFLNATVAEVEKNNINPVLQKRRALLKQYSLIMRSIKKKLDEAKYKSIDKDVSKLLKTYENLKTLPATANQTAINVDEAVNIIFDANKLVQSSALSAINNEEEKLLALASIDFMQTLIDSILSTIPEKYSVYTKELSKDLFSKSELAELENIIITMTNKNKKTKSMELKKNMDIINISFNPSDTLKKLNSLEIIDIADKPLTRDSTVEIINQEIRNNLDKAVLKDVGKIFQEIDRNELADITKEASDIASEVASSSSVKEATSNRAVDREYGGQSLKNLIGAARR